MNPEFCPFCGKRTLLDQGGDEEYEQFECASKKCNAYFSIRVFDSEFRDEEEEE